MEEPFEGSLKIENRLIPMPTARMDMGTGPGERR